MQAGGGQQGSGHAVLIFSVFIKHHSPARTERQQAEQDKAPRYCHWQGTGLPLPAPSTNPVPQDILEQKVPMLLIHDEPREHSPMHPPRAEPELRGGRAGSGARRAHICSTYSTFCPSKHISPSKRA